MALRHKEVYMKEFIISAITVFDTVITIYILILILGCIKRSKKVDPAENYFRFVSSIIRPIIILAFLKEYEVATGISKEKAMMVMLVIAAILAMVVKQILYNEMLEIISGQWQDNDEEDDS